MDLHTRWGPDPHARGNFEGNDVRIFSHANACYRSSRVSHEKSLLWCGLSSKFFVHLLLLLLLLLLLHIRIIIIVVPSSIKFVNSSRDSTVNLYAWNVTSVSAAEWQCAVLRVTSEQWSRDLQVRETRASHVDVRAVRQDAADRWRHRRDWRRQHALLLNIASTPSVHSAT